MELKILEISAISEQFQTLRICVIIPTFNNAATLKPLIEGVLRYTGNVIVINDGSTDNTPEILKNFPQVNVVNLPVNGGKGIALRTGFKTAVNAGYEYAISIDSDGQHFPDDLPAFIKKFQECGPSLIIGARNMDQQSVPGKSSFGNKFSSFWFWVETGLKLPDTQSGYRLYPVRRLMEMNFFTRKFEFEIEVIVRAAWSGIAVIPVPVRVYYAPAAERVSHFRPFKDFTRISILNTFLVIVAFVYIKPRDFIRSLFKRSTYIRFYEELRGEKTTVLNKALSIGFGVFMGIIPIWGFQLIVAISLSILLRLNKLLVIIAANISIPPMIPLIIFLSFRMGRIFIDDPALRIRSWHDFSLATIKMNFLQYVYGSILLAIVSGLLAFAITAGILLFSPVNRNQKG